MRIKEQYQGMAITRGGVMLNLKTLKEENYQYYYNNGFADIFEMEEIIEEKPKANTKKKKTKEE